MKKNFKTIKKSLTLIIMIKIMTLKYKTLSMECQTLESISSHDLVIDYLQEKLNLEEEEWIILQVRMVKEENH